MTSKGIGSRGVRDSAEMVTGRAKSLEFAVKDWKADWRAVEAGQVGQLCWEDLYGKIHLLCQTALLCMMWPLQWKML